MSHIEQEIEQLEQSNALDILTLEGLNADIRVIASKFRMVADKQNADADENANANALALYNAPKRRRAERLWKNIDDRNCEIARLKSLEVFTKRTRWSHLK